jgi:hypothetical protein
MKKGKGKRTKNVKEKGEKTEDKGKSKLKGSNNCKRGKKS